MAVDFSSNPDARGFFAPNRFEAAIHDCEVLGTIPADIRGTFYRTGGDLRFPRRFIDDAPFNDDGFVDMFRFADGRVDFRARHVRTERFLAERSAHRALFGYYRNLRTADPSVRNLSYNVANTNIVFHAGKLLVLKETSPPIAINPHTLATESIWTFSGRLTSPTFTAHPKIDPVTGEMIAYGYATGGDATREIAFFWIDAKGEVTREIRFEAPTFSMLHDIAVSREHIIVPTTGFTSSVQRLERGQIYWGFDPRQPIHVGIFRRDGDGKDLRWFRCGGGQVIHTVNAVSDGDRLLLDAPISDGNPFPFFPAIDGTPFDPTAALTTMRRWEFNLRQRDGGWREQTLFPGIAGGGLARMDDRYLTLPFRYSFLGFTDPGKPFDEARGGNLRGRVTNCYARFDHATGAVSTLFAGPTHSLQECCFVPRQHSRGEGDGYLIGVASDFAAMRSELVIADAAHLEEGIIGRVKLPFRLHAQVHGSWVDAAALPVA
jgi:carotenoid cleavage dioxygenase